MCSVTVRSWLKWDGVDLYLKYELVGLNIIRVDAAIWVLIEF